MAGILQQMTPPLHSLESLGRRICIIGPSCCGKSTLADRLALKIGTRAIHLDLLAHIPGTNWVRAPEEQFIARHDEATAGECWIMEGNYSVCMEKRLSRATSVIWIDPPRHTFLPRYLKRTYSRNIERMGHLAGAKDRFNWKLVWYTMTRYPRSRRKYESFLKKFPIPVLRISSMRKLNSYYGMWKISP